ncbi:MAG: restriction endonuclease subunit S [Ruminococcus sp.]|nr:restriction endonuclease subunit S [Ruminococcus sp.]
MSRLNNLINELCPDGVEYVKIKDTFQRLKGTPITAGKMKEIAREDGELKIFAGGKTVVNAYEKDIPKANIIKVPAVLVQSRGLIDFIYYEKQFTFKNEMWAYTANNKITVKYLYYVLQNNKQYFRDYASDMGSLPQISLHVTEDFKIPFPPLAVQREIVRILDNFTELTQELTQELTLRKKQYLYYRDKLLTFGDDVEYKALGEITTVSRGIRVVKKQLETTGNIPVYQNSMTPLGYYKKSNCKLNTTFVIGAGAAGEIGFSSVEFWAADDCYYFVCSEKILDRFLYYALLCQYTFIKLQVRKASIPRLARSVIENLKIPVPPIEEQEKIVKILDKFDTLCNDLTNGIPAEINARQKQYEYYRDRLLQFKIKNS